MIQQTGGTHPSIKEKIVLKKIVKIMNLINKIHLKTTKVAMINQIHKTKIQMIKQMKVLMVNHLIINKVHQDKINKTTVNLVKWIKK